jgi:hypothetical protein
MSTDTELLTASPENDDDGRVHILDHDANPSENLIWTFLCGDHVVVGEDGMMFPPEDDCYILGHGHEKATCKRCRKAAGLR